LVESGINVGGNEAKTIFGLFVSAFTFDVVRGFSTI
jgi:hypothetical protein